jgi:predicted AAA+ superfamily ATPase
LGGRAHLHNLFPITTQELSLSGIQSWEILLARGGIPSIIQSPTAAEDLDAYIGLYLQEEIQSEALVRSLPDFSRFLTIAGSLNGQQVNFEKLASDVGVSAKIVRSYLKILEDTLIADLVLPLDISKKRKAVSAPKFYFFDVGIANTLRGVSHVPRGSEAFGDALEHLVYLELKAQRSYRRLKHSLFFWRTQTKIEVDFVLQLRDVLVAIEVKGTEFPDSSDMKGLKAFAEDFPNARRILVCNTALSAIRKDGIEIMTAHDFFSELWKGSIHPK